MTPKVFSLSRPSPLAAQLVRRAWHETNQVIVFSLNDETHTFLKQEKISPIPLRHAGNISWRDRDIKFKREIMDDPRLAVLIPGTELPLWKVIGLDRLSFWFDPRADELAETILLTDGEHFCTLDFQFPAMWQLAARIPVTAIQHTPVRSREMYDLAKYLPFHKIVVQNAVEESFLKARGYPGEIEHLNQPFLTPKPIEDSERRGLREGLGIPENAKVGWVLYESQTEWAFRRWVNVRKPEDETIWLVCPETPVDYENLILTVPQEALRRIGARVVLTDSMEAAADFCVTFRYKADLVLTSRLPIRFMDVSNRFLSKELAS